MHFYLSNPLDFHEKGLSLSMVNFYELNFRPEAPPAQDTKSGEACPMQGIAPSDSTASRLALTNRKSPTIV